MLAGYQLQRVQIAISRKNTVLQRFIAIASGFLRLRSALILRRPPIAAIEEMIP